MKQKADPLHVTPDLLVLKTLRAGPAHGWDIARRIRRQVSRYVPRVKQGSPYPALHRLKAQGRIASEWGASDNNGRAKFYKPAAAGRGQSAAETGTWGCFSEAIGLIPQNT